MLFFVRQREPIWLLPWKVPQRLSHCEYFITFKTRPTMNNNNKENCTPLRIVYHESIATDRELRTVTKHKIIVQYSPP